MANRCPSRHEANRRNVPLGKGFGAISGKFWRKALQNMGFPRKWTVPVLKLGAYSSC
jgi:hypothetical protein